MSMQQCAFAGLLWHSAYKRTKCCLSSCTFSSSHTTSQAAQAVAACVLGRRSAAWLTRGMLHAGFSQGATAAAILLADLARSRPELLPAFCILVRVGGLLILCLLRGDPRQGCLQARARCRVAAW